MDNFIDTENFENTIILSNLSTVCIFKSNHCLLSSIMYGCDEPSIKGKIDSACCI